MGRVPHERYADCTRGVRIACVGSSEIYGPDAISHAGSVDGNARDDWYVHDGMGWLDTNEQPLTMYRYPE